MQREEMLKDRKTRLSSMNILMTDIYDISKDINRELVDQEDKYI